MPLPRVDLTSFYDWTASVYRKVSHKYSNPFLQLLYLDKTVSFMDFKSEFKMNARLVAHALKDLIDADFVRKRTEDQKYELTKLGRTLVEELNKRAIELYKGIKKRLSPETSTVLTDVFEPPKLISNWYGVIPGCFWTRSSILLPTLSTPTER